MSKYDIYKRLFQSNTLEEFENFCYFNRQHHNRYKPFNCALIMAQRPGAMYVRTENAWNKDGFMLKPEAMPIVIMQVGGPVTLVYDREDVLGAETPLLPEDINDAAEQNKYEINDLVFAKWQNLLRSKGIRIAEGKLGERMHGASSVLDNRVAISYTDLTNNKIKYVDAYHQITLNSNRSTHEKALTLLHELGHIYCGHIAGERTKINGLPAYRYDRQDWDESEITARLFEIKDQMDKLKDDKSREKEYNVLCERYDKQREWRNEFIRHIEDQKEYEAELVCKLLCERNGIINTTSDEYLRQHTSDGIMPDIDLISVLDAVEKIAGILDI